MVADGEELERWTHRKSIHEESMQKKYRRHKREKNKFPIANGTAKLSG